MTNSEMLKGLDEKQIKTFKLIVSLEHVYYMEMKLKLAMRALDGNTKCKQLLDVLQAYEMELAAEELQIK